VVIGVSGCESRMVRGRLFMDRITGNYYFFVPDEPVYMEWFDEYLAVLYLMPDEARYLFTEDELLDVDREGFSFVSMQKEVIEELSVS